MNTLEYLKKQTSIVVNLYNTKRFEEAIAKSKVLIKKFSEQTIFYNILSLSLSAKGKNDESIKYLNQALKLEPHNYFVLNNLGLIYTKMNILEKAESYLSEALKKSPNFFDALINYGNLLMKQNRDGKAVKIFTHSLKISKNSIHKELALIALGNVFQQMGDFTKSKEMYEEVLKINPKNTLADKGISVSHKYKSAEDIHLKSMEEKIEKIENENELKPLYFALGKAYEDIANVELSFKYISLGNEIEKKQIKYDINKDQKLVGDICNFFSNKIINKISQSNKKIIFITGMPRSGTTLTEQIISSHSKVHGAGELSFLSEFFDKENLENDYLNKYMDVNIEKELLIPCQNYYFKKLDSLNINEDIIVDKAPLNFRWIGFIVNAFPNSKIIHCERDPMAVCWSNFKNSFTSKSIGFSYDLNDLAKYYKLYKELMNFWQKLYAKDIYNLDYQKLVSNKDEEIKKIINFCELDWEEACLFPERNRKSVSTASVSQVRSPIYKTSVNSWEKYSDKLQSINEVLNKD